MKRSSKNFQNKYVHIGFSDPVTGMESMLISLRTTAIPSSWQSCVLMKGVCKANMLSYKNRN